MWHIVLLSHLRSLVYFNAKIGYDSTKASNKFHTENKLQSHNYSYKVFGPFFHSRGLTAWHAWHQVFSIRQYLTLTIIFLLLLYSRRQHHVISMTDFWGFVWLYLVCFGCICVFRSTHISRYWIQQQFHIGNINSLRITASKIFCVYPEHKVFTLKVFDLDFNTLFNLTYHKDE